MERGVVKEQKQTTKLHPYQIIFNQLLNYPNITNPGNELVRVLVSRVDNNQKDFWKILESNGDLGYVLSTPLKELDDEPPSFKLADMVEHERKLVEYLIRYDGDYTLAKRAWRKDLRDTSINLALRSSKSTGDDSNELLPVEPYHHIRTSDSITSIPEDAQIIRLTTTSQFTLENVHAMKLLAPGLQKILLPKSLYKHGVTEAMRDKIKSFGIELEMALDTRRMSSAEKAILNNSGTVKFVDEIECPAYLPEYRLSEYLIVRRVLNSNPQYINSLELSERDVDILCDTFHLKDLYQTPLSTVELSVKYSISGVRVSQIRKGFIDKIKNDFPELFEQGQSSG